LFFYFFPWLKHACIFFVFAENFFKYAKFYKENKRFTSMLL